jgi:orotate phosphoribosyltransferase
LEIECDTLTADDWATLAILYARIGPRFGAVFGIPTGGYPFRSALRHYIVADCPTVLIADDVLTTGDSMERMHRCFGVGVDVRGVVAFCRAAVCSPWVTALFTLEPSLAALEDRR